MSVLLLRHPQFLGPRKKPSWVFAPQPRRCLHRPSSSVTSHSGNVGVQILCAEQQPLGMRGRPVGPGALRYPKFDWEGPGRGRPLVAAPASRWWAPVTLSIPKTACACGAGWKSPPPPQPIETKAATGTTVTERGQLCNVREQHLILETKICFVCFVFRMCRSCP